MIRPHLKMLSGDYLCFAYLASDRGLDPSCRLCQSLSHLPVPSEDLEHLLARCKATGETRNRYLPEVLNTVAKYFPTSKILNNTNTDILTQFLLDCSSLNLSQDFRIPNNHPNFIEITRHCSIMIHGIHRDRTRQLKDLGLLGN